MLEKKQNEINYNYEFNFTIKINEHILVTREFNVKKYNDKFRESLEAKELMDDLMGNGNATGYLGLIPKYLVNNSINALWQSYDYEPNVPKREKSDILVLEINKKFLGDTKETILSTYYDVSNLQYRVRTQIDLKPILKTVINNIKEAMSQDKYTLTYGDTKLTRLNKITRKQLEAIYERQ